MSRRDIVDIQTRKHFFFWVQFQYEVGSEVGNIAAKCMECTELALAGDSKPLTTLCFCTHSSISNLKHTSVSEPSTN